MAGNLMEQLNTELKNFLQEEHRAVPKLLAKMEQSTNVKRENIVYGMASVIAAYLVLGHGAELLCNAIGFAYPAYASFEAIETENKDDDTQWLTYWTVFGTTSLIDFASDKIIGIFPIYWLVKCMRARSGKDRKMGKNSIVNRRPSVVKRRLTTVIVNRRASTVDRRSSSVD